MMLPMSVDLRQMLLDLNERGYNDHKIESWCEFSQGYVIKLHRGEIEEMFHSRFLRLYNLWADVMSSERAQPLVTLTT